MNKFYLEIITPEKVFFRGEAESVNIPSIGGACTIMAGHQPMVFATEPGTIRITADGETREAFMSEGFIEVRPDETIAFAQAVEWPEDIDERRAEELIASYIASLWGKCQISGCDLLLLARELYRKDPKAFEANVGLIPSGIEADIEVSVKGAD